MFDFDNQYVVVFLFSLPIISLLPNCDAVHLEYLEVKRVVAGFGGNFRPHGNQIEQFEADDLLVSIERRRWSIKKSLDTTPYEPRNYGKFENFGTLAVR